jgi:hypothetical protein
MAALYGARKRSLWMSIRVLGLADRLAKKVSLGGFGKKTLARLIFMDRLETWRAIHVALGVFAMLPMWWHIQRAHTSPSPLEWLLFVGIGALLLSGLVGSLVQDRFPHLAGNQLEREVRLKDVDYELRVLIKRAADDAPGYGPDVDAAYQAEIDPILHGRERSLRLLWATLRHKDPAARACARARKRVGQFAEKGEGYDKLLALAERKVRLDQNRCNLAFSTGWLPFHVGAVLMVGFLLIFHIIGALMFRLQ